MTRPAEQAPCFSVPANWDLGRRDLVNSFSTATVSSFRLSETRFVYGSREHCAGVQSCAQTYAYDQGSPTADDIRSPGSILD